MPLVSPRITEKENKLLIDQFLEIGLGHFDVHLGRLCESDCSLGSIFLHAKSLLLPKARLFEVEGSVIYVLGKWRYGGCVPFVRNPSFRWADKESSFGVGILISSFH